MRLVTLRPLASPVSALIAVIGWSAPLTLSAADTPPATATPPAASAGVPPVSDPIQLVEPHEFPGAQSLNELGRARLRTERTIFATEIRRTAARKNQDPAQVETALAAFDRGALDTALDNRRRFAELLAVINPIFAEGWALYKNGRWAEAAAGPFEKLIFERITLVKAAYKHNTMPPGQYTLVRFLQAECQARMGDLSKALIGYHVVWTMAPKSLTVGAASAQRPALIYEESSRAHFALWLYQAILDHNGEHLADLDALRLANKVGELLTTDPYRIGSRQSREAVARIKRGETSALTREVQARILAELERMGPLPESEPFPFLEYKNVINQGADKGGTLREGKNPEEFLTTGTGDFNGGADWGRLRPRERQQLLQLFQETYPQRYQEMLADYFRGISAAESEAPSSAK